VLVARVVQTLRLWQTSGDQAVAHIKYVPDSPDDKWRMVGPKWGKHSSPQRLASFLFDRNPSVAGRGKLPSPQATCYLPPTGYFPQSHMPIPFFPRPAQGNRVFPRGTRPMPESRILSPGDGLGFSTSRAVIRSGSLGEVNEVFKNPIGPGCEGGDGSTTHSEGIVLHRPSQRLGP
jgi:hypothetical protein